MTDVPVGLLDLLSAEEIQRLQDAFAEATGVASVITAPDGHPLTRPSRFSRLCQDLVRTTELGLQNCMRSDAELGRPNPDGPVIRPCLSCGLWDGGASIFAGKHHIANWLIGQVRNASLDEAKILSYAREIGADEEAFRAALGEVTVMSTDRFRAVCDFLFLMANQLSAIAWERLEDRRRLEESRRAAAERLELEMQLHRARQLQSVGQLAGGIAHDFNNLLTVILGNVELLSMGPPDEPVPVAELRSTLGEIREAAERARALTRQLLAFARQQVSSPVVLDLSELVAKLGPMLKRLLPANIDLVFTPEPAAPYVRADRAQIEQVVINLVTNASDAMPDGGTLHLSTAAVMLDADYVRAHHEALEGLHVVLSCKDSGTGMSADVAARVFEPFFTTKASGKGTGLGLSTVYGIVKQAGGSITVDSGPGVGTELRVFLPAAEGTPAAPESPVDDALAVWGHETILLVEDSDPVRAFAERVLVRAGYRVVAAASGEDALTIARAAGAPRFNLLLTDVVMTGMNGRALADTLQATHAGLPVLYASGYTADVIARHGVLEPGISLIEKPYSGRALLQAVRRKIGR